MVTVIMGVRSYNGRDEYSFIVEHAFADGAWGWREWSAVSGAGELCLSTGHRVYRDPFNIKFIKATLRGQPFGWKHDGRVQRPIVIYRLPNVWNRIGFYADHRWDGTWMSGSFRLIAVPDWFLLALFALLPLLWLRAAWSRRRRPPPGRCICGYDLRASKERCPECGTHVPMTSTPR